MSVPECGESNAMEVSVSCIGGTPEITSLSPTFATAGGLGFTLTVNGVNFRADSVVVFNGVNKTTTFVSSVELQASILAGDIASEGLAVVTVNNPSPGCGLSGPFPFMISAAAAGGCPCPPLFFIKDDFVSGLIDTNTFVNQIGELGWHISWSSFVSPIEDVARIGHPGIMDMFVIELIDAWSAIYLGNSNIGGIPWTLALEEPNWEMTWVLAFDCGDPATGGIASGWVVFGIMDDTPASAFPPETNNRSVYFKCTHAGNWFANVSNVTPNVTSTDTGVAVRKNGWTNFRMTKTAGSIDFFIDDYTTPVATINTNIPTFASARSWQPFLMFVSDIGNSGVQKYMGTIDYFSLSGTDITELRNNNAHNIYPGGTPVK